MQSMLNWARSKTGVVVLVDVFLTLIVPFILPLLGASAAMRVGLLFIVINMAWAFASGKLLRGVKWRWALIFLFPLLFGLMVLVRYASYNYLFMAIYLLLTTLSMAEFS